MAAPVVTGSVTLIRQYFTDGFYPTGAKVAANSFKPSGPLIKAALLGGASSMLGNTAVRRRKGREARSRAPGPGRALLRAGGCRVDALASQRVPLSPPF
jgi:hypothetical protein